MQLNQLKGRDDAVDAVAFAYAATGRIFEKSV